MDWLRSEDLKEEKNVTTPIIIIAVGSLLHSVVAEQHKAYHLGMSRIRLESLDPVPSDPSVAAAVLGREEPDDEEDEEEDEGDGKEDGDDDEDDDGYSE